jgi:DNA-binding transcriptional MerR regulator
VDYGVGSKPLLVLAPRRNRELEMGEESLRIGGAARELGTTTRTLRYYEEYGLLPRPDISAGGQRRYEPADLQRAREILTLRRLGLSLETISAVLDNDAVREMTALAETQASLVRLLSR